LQCHHTQLWNRLEARCVLMFLRPDLLSTFSLSQRLPVEKNPGE
jgi:hypothetical protein